MLPRTVICDIDGTLADCEHRKHHIIDPAKRDWDSFHAGIPNDNLHVWCSDLIEVLRKAGILVYLVTARPEPYRAHTMEWLNKHGVGYDGLIMRPKGDFRNDPIIKKEMYDEHFKDKKNVLFVIDDRNRVVEMWRSLGLICLQPYLGDF